MSPEPRPADPSPPARTRWVKAGVFAVKAAIAALLLSWLVNSGRLDLRHLLDVVWTPRAWALVALGLAGVGLGIVLLGWRLSLMARSLDIPLGVESSCGLTAIGLFTGSILPGVVGGDVVKVVYLCRGEGASRRALATLAVVGDRAVGLFSLFLLGTLALAAAWLTGSLPSSSPLLFILPGVVGAAAVGMVFFGRSARAPAAGAIPTGRSVAARFAQARAVARHFLRRPGLLAGCVALGVVNHGLVCATFLVAAALLGVCDLSAVQQFLLNPLAMAMNVVPVTPGGVGVAESAFSYLYEGAGCPSGAAVGIVGRVLQYVAYVLAGLPAFLLRDR